MISSKSGLDPKNIARIARILTHTYGNPRHGNKKNPLDELIYIILSTRTQERSFQKTYLKLKRAFPSWNEVGSKDRRKIRGILKANGLARLKTDQILAILKILQDRFGKATLAPLKDMSDSNAEEFLIQLPGVSRKVAKCVLMYSMDRRVLPVDIHVHRVARRIGLKVKNRPDTSQELIELAIPGRYRYSFHVNAIAHGRTLCTPRNPKCERCPISDSCQFFINDYLKDYEEKYC